MAPLYALYLEGLENFQLCSKKIDHWILILVEQELLTRCRDPGQEPSNDGLFPCEESEIIKIRKVAAAVRSYFWWSSVEPLLELVSSDQILMAPANAHPNFQAFQRDATFPTFQPQHAKSGPHPTKILHT